MTKMFFWIFFWVPFIGYGQSWWNNYPYETYINFDDTLDLQYLTIDTVSNPNNIWQIGAPQKINFTTAYSIPNVIVTDTVNNYPINDTSSFILIHEFVNGSDDFLLEGWYFSNTDSLNDFGKIEISPDNGLNWILISSDTSTYWGGGSTYYNWPIITNLNLTGNSGGWQPFLINMNNSQGVFTADIGDTVLFRFTFISDANAEIMDGIMFDNLRLFDAFVFGVKENRNEDLNIFPNPVQNEINFSAVETQIKELTIYTMDGRIALSQCNLNDQKCVDVSFLISGSYIVKLVTETSIYSIKIFKD